MSRNRRKKYNKKPKRTSRSEYQSPKISDLLSPFFVSNLPQREVLKKNVRNYPEYEPIHHKSRFRIETEALARMSANKIRAAVIPSAVTALANVRWPGQPKKDICHQRRDRRSILFATARVGRGISAKGMIKKYIWKSKVKC